MLLPSYHSLAQNFQQLPVNHSDKFSSPVFKFPSTGPSFQIQLHFSPNSSDPARGLMLIFLTTPRFWLMLIFLAPPSFFSQPVYVLHFFKELSQISSKKCSWIIFLQLSTLHKIQNYSSMLLFLFSASKIIVHCCEKRPWGFFIPHSPPPLNLDMRNLRPRGKMRRKVTNLWRG